MLCIYSFKDLNERTERNTKLLRARLLYAYHLELRGWSITGTQHEMHTAAFVRALLLSELSADFLTALLEVTAYQSDCLTAFTEVRLYVRQTASIINVYAVGISTGANSTQILRWIWQSQGSDILVCAV